MGEEWGAGWRQMLGGSSLAVSADCSWEHSQMGPAHRFTCVGVWLPDCRRDILNSYGHQHLLTLTSLAKAGAVVAAEQHRGLATESTGSSPHPPGNA